MMPYLRALSKRLARALSTSLAYRTNVPQNLLGWTCCLSKAFNFPRIIITNRAFLCGSKNSHETFCDREIFKYV